MVFYSRLAQLMPLSQGRYVTIGNFDGVHLGHSAVIDTLKQSASAQHLTCTVVTFEPHPSEFFQPQKAPARLTNLREKVVQLASLGVDEVLLLRFNRRLAHLSATDFVQQILVQALKTRHLVVGDDFRFGRDRQGDFALLRHMGESHGFTVAKTPSFCVDNKRVSSTQIRSCLATGDLSQAQALLGRHYSLSGRVIHGDHVGRQWGFPTANLRVKRKILPLSGIFAVQAHGIAPQALAGVASIGTRPTVDGKREQVEVHLLNFQQDIYGHYVTLDFLQRFRDELRFDSVAALVEQIKRDVCQAQVFFDRYS